MVRKVRNGLKIKIGYGQKNETLYDEDGSSIGVRSFFERERSEAIAYLETVILFIEDGGFNAAFENKLEDYRSRAEKGKEARRRKKQASNVAPISKAA